MADTVVSPLIWVLSDRLNGLTGDSDNRIWKKMRLTLSVIQTLVLDTEQRRENNLAIKCWLSEVKDVAYDLDDLFDEFELLTLRTKKGTLMNKVKTLILLKKPFMLGLQGKLQDIEGRFDELVTRMEKLPSRSAEVGLNPIVGRHTSSSVFESAVYGREQDKECLMELLFSSKYDNERPVSVIPIVGMGGIGKTTLAQLIYNDEKVDGYFDLRVWVSVGDEFDAIEVAKGILEAATMKRHDVLNADLLGTQLEKILRGKRFLIVLDDLWNENYNKWSMLVRWFSMGAWGSKVILTTRSDVVASITGTVPSYYLVGLSEEDCWSLFSSVAFGTSRAEENPKLLEVGRRIVKKCKGLPLAVKILGGLMHSKTEEIEWWSMLKEDLWNSYSEENGILPILSLSYTHLPSHLKQCFAFCSIFRKDEKINKEMLIQLWIASGFIRSPNESKSLEDIGHDYLKELLQRSFFMDATRDEYGDIVEFQMHDLVHDLALFIGGTEFGIVVSRNLNGVSNHLRHSSFVGISGLSIIPVELHEARKLRTLLLLSGKLKNITSIIPAFRCLRVLSLSRSGIRELPDSIGNLRHLRYLDLSRTSIAALPQSIGNLKLLQTMGLSECYNLLELPRAISELINLRHLNIQSCSLLSHMPSGIGKLRLLQTLPTFILGKSDNSCCLSELNGLYLRGRLEIKNLEHVKNLENAYHAMLYAKPCLHSLGFSWGHNVDTRGEMPVTVLESLKPPTNLKVLDITGYKGSNFPSWITNQGLLNLVKVSLINCSCPELPPLGQLPYLKDLYIKGMIEVQIMGEEFCGKSIVRGFPSLKQLELYDMPNLLEWSVEINDESSLNRIEELSHTYRGSFFCLETLTLKGCSKLTSLPQLPNLKNLALWNSNEMLLCSLAHLTSLSSLVINEFREPMVSPMDLGSLNSIRTLTLYDCDNLIFLLEDGMQGFTSLKNLSILYCDNLSFLPEGLRYLTSLQKLAVVECQKLVKIPDVMQYLSSLEELVIEGCPILKSLPDGLHYLTNLQKLVIH